MRIEEETFWLTQEQMAQLFNQMKQIISLHINNCYKEKELEMSATVKESLTVRKEGKRMVSRKIDFYNLDVNISVDYRIKSRSFLHQIRVNSKQELIERIYQGIEKINKKPVVLRWKYKMKAAACPLIKVFTTR